MPHPINRAGIQLLRLALSLALLAGFAFSTRSSRAAQVDVCVYGATPGGIAAALAAAESGRSVALVEPTHRIGGLLTSGLSHTDFHSFESLTGAFLDFTHRVKAHYVATYGPDSPQVRHCFEGTFAEPKVNLLVLQRMLAEHSAIQIHLQTRLTTVRRAGRTLASATFQTAHQAVDIEARVFIDGTYEGDLMALAGVEYRVGREGRDVYDESLAPESGDNQLQGYNFRFCATNRPENRAPVLAPPGYDRGDFLAVLPFLQPGRIEHVFDYPSKCIFKAQTPPLPNGKYDINDVSRGVVRLSLPGRNLKWPEGTPAERQAIFQEHLRFNTGLLYFLQNDPDVPERYQAEAREWGWCRDEFTETQHLPPQLYVREARRMIGRHVYIQQDGEAAAGDARAVLHPDSIAMGDYGNNCHGTRHEGPLIGGRHSGEFYHPVPPYQIPYGVLLPREIDNLLVPVAASSSHVGFCALRLEPIWTSLGQAAGHAAALAIRTSSPMHQVRVADLQRRLHQAGSATIYFSDILPGHQTFEAVQWWGSAGGFHHLNPPPKNGPRGKNLHGQYYEAAPGHAADLDRPVDADLRNRWNQLAASLKITPPLPEASPTRGTFIRTVFDRRPVDRQNQ